MSAKGLVMWVKIQKKKKHHIIVENVMKNSMIKNSERKKTSHCCEKHDKELNNWKLRKKKKNMNVHKARENDKSFLVCNKKKYHNKQNKTSKLFFLQSLRVWCLVANQAQQPYNFYIVYWNETLKRIA